METVTKNEDQKTVKSNKQTLEDQVTSAVVSYKAKHPSLSPEEITKFRKDLETRIQKSAERAAGLSDTHARNLRAKTVAEAVAAHNIGFKTLRPEISNLIDERLVAVVSASNGNYLETMQSTYESVTSNHGGLTFAYVLETVAGRLYAKVAVAICRDDENFDGLLGKEIAINRLLDGKTISVELTHSGLFTNKLSTKELIDLSNKYSETVLHAEI